MSERTSEWLGKFGLVPRRDLAAMLGVSEKTLQNRPRNRQPAEIVRVGNSTFYTEASVRAFLEQHTVKQDA